MPHLLLSRNATRAVSLHRKLWFSFSIQILSDFSLGFFLCRDLLGSLVDSFSQLGSSLGRFILSVGFLSRSTHSFRWVPLSGDSFSPLGSFLGRLIPFVGFLSRAIHSLRWVPLLGDSFSLSGFSDRCHAFPVASLRCAFNLIILYSSLLFSQ